MVIPKWKKISKKEYTGGLHLSEEEAIKIQNEFGDYIVEQLNKNING